MPLTHCGPACRPSQHTKKGLCNGFVFDHPTGREAKIRCLLLDIAHKVFCESKGKPLMACLCEPIEARIRFFSRLGNRAINQTVFDIQGAPLQLRQTSSQDNRNLMAGVVALRVSVLVCHFSLHRIGCQFSMLVGGVLLTMEGSMCFRFCAVLDPLKLSN